VFGSIATYLGNKKIGDSTHEWICYVRGVNNENISYFVEKVVFVLHSSFQDTNRGNINYRIYLKW
jgi:transcription initiation factor IIF auxiliary subunit